MPFFRLCDRIQLFYLSLRSLSSHPSPPWLLILHPLFLDLSFTFAYVHGKGNLLARFNILLLDLRSHGRTRSAVLPSCDLWTLAADLAFLLRHLAIPRVHLLALDVHATELALRLAGLFPDLVLSACLCGMPPPAEQGFLQTAFAAVMASWVDPELPGDWEAAVSATQWWLYGPRTNQMPRVADEWAGVMIRRYAPCNAVRCLGSCVAYTELLVCIVRVTGWGKQQRESPGDLAAYVKAPILALHGGLENIYDLPTAQNRFSELQNVPPTSGFRILEDAPLQMFDTHPEMVKEHYYPWIDSILEAASSSSTASAPMKVDETIDLLGALERLSKLANQPSIKQRDPRLSSSFYAWSESKLRSNKERLDFLETNQRLKFSLVGGGAPECWTGASFEERNPWRFSARFRGQESQKESQCAVEEMITAITESTLGEEEHSDRATPDPSP